MCVHLNTFLILTLFNCTTVSYPSLLIQQHTPCLHDCLSLKDAQPRFFFCKCKRHLRIKYIKRDGWSIVLNIDPSSFFFPFSFVCLTPPFFSRFEKRMTISSRQHTQDRLDYYYKVINKTIIAKQNASSGLMPASTAITVRQNIAIKDAIFTLCIEPRRLYRCLGQVWTHIQRGRRRKKNRLKTVKVLV